MPCVNILNALQYSVIFAVGFFVLLLFFLSFSFYLFVFFALLDKVYCDSIAIQCLPDYKFADAINAQGKKCQSKS